MAKRSIRLLLDEGLDSPIDLLPRHYDAYQMAMASHDRRNAVYQLEKTKYYEELSGGEGSPDAKKYDMLLQQCA